MLDGINPAKLYHMSRKISCYIKHANEEYIKKLVYLIKQVDEKTRGKFIVIQGLPSNST